MGLHELLGLSDRYTAEFLVGLARKASSSESYLQQLENTGAITINDDVRSFASQLHVGHNNTIRATYNVFFMSYKYC